MDEIVHVTINNSTVILQYWINTCLQFYLLDITEFSQLYSMRLVKEKCVMPNQEESEVQGYKSNKLSPASEKS